MKLKSIATVLALLFFFPIKGNAYPAYNGPDWLEKLLKNEETVVEVLNKNGKHKTGYLKMDSEVDFSMAQELISGIQQLNTQGAEAIVLEINTPGGSVSQGFKIARAMESSKATIYCVVDQAAISMGYYILQSCDVRLMTKRSILMIHAPLVIDASVTGDESEFAKIFLQLHVLTEAMIDQFSRRTNVSIDEMRARIAHSGQWWVNWKEALDRKMVDGLAKNANDVLMQLMKDGSVKY